jgi:hypothetical protein
LQNLIAPAAALLMVLCALPLIATPSVRRVASWMKRQAGPVDEPAIIATRAALQRIGFLSGAVLVVLAVALMISDLDFYLAMVGYALAVVVGAAARMGGSERRRAGLATVGDKSTVATGLFRIALGLGAFTVLVAVVAFFHLGSVTAAGRGMLTLPSDFWLAGIDIRQLAVIAAASALVSVLACACLLAVARRQSIAGATPEADRLVRAMCSRRIAYGALGGQAILFGALVPAVQVFTLDVSAFSYTVNEGVVTAGSAIGLAMIFAGIVSCAWAVLFPVWIARGAVRTGHMPRVLPRTLLRSERVRRVWTPANERGAEPDGN